MGKPLAVFTDPATPEAVRRMHWDEERTVQHIAKVLGCSRKSLYEFMERHGIAARNQSDAMPLRLRQAGPEGRKALTDAAHDAVRGMKRSWPDRCTRALGVQTQGLQSRHEEALFDLLSSRGCEPTPAYALGIYNVDLAFPKIRLAIEVDGGNWHSSPRKIPFDQRKEAHLRSMNWYLVRVPSLNICDATADNIVALVKVLETLPPGPC